MSDDVVFESPSVPSSAPAVLPRVPWFRRPLVAAALGLVVGAGLVGGAWAASGSSGPAALASFTLHGSLDLAGDHIPVPPENTNCEGTGGYDDIVEGAAVTVYDAGGKVVAEGTLGAGVYADPVNFTGDCEFPFTVLNVPSGAKFYQEEITHRGKITMSVAEAQSGTFGATLGG